jgi:hypothetical protein
VRVYAERDLSALRRLARSRASIDESRKQNLIQTAQRARWANEGGIGFAVIAAAADLSERRLHQLCREHAPTTRDPKPGPGKRAGASGL